MNIIHKYQIGTVICIIIINISKFSNKKSHSIKKNKQTKFLTIVHKTKAKCENIQTQNTFISFTIEDSVDHEAYNWILAAVYVSFQMSRFYLYET